MIAVAIAIIGLALTSRSASGTTPDQALAPAPDSHSIGAVTLFDAMGLPVSGGDNLHHLAAFAQADTPVTTAGSQALMYFAIPDPAVTDPNNWTATQASSESAFPTTALGASVSTPTLATVTISPEEGNLASFLQRLGVRGSVVVELRLLAATAGHTDTAKYWTVNLSVDVGAGSWRTLGTVDPGPTPTYLSAVTPGPQHAGDLLTLSAKIVTTDGAHPAGTVELFDGRTDNGPALYDQATGVVAATVLGQSGDRRYRFVFTPNDPAHATGSQSAELRCTIRGGMVQPLHEKLVLLAVPTASRVALSVTSLFAYLSPPSAHGRVRFVDSVSGTLGDADVAGGVATLLTNALAEGTHVVVATFTAGTNQPFGSASKSARPFTLVPSTAPTSSGDAQSAKVAVNPGQLTITTPYTPDHPFDLGSLVLAADGSRLTASGHFGTATTARTAGITVTDTRGGGDGAWTASVSSTNFVSGVNTISAQNLGFINIHSVAVEGSGGGGLGTDAKPVIATDLLPSTTVVGPDAPGTAGLAGESKSFAKATHGAGSVYLYGDIVLNAPTASAAGSYTATLTFTVG